MPGFNLGVPGSHNINALWAWGGAADGKLGNNTTTPDIDSPAQIGTFTDWEVLSPSSNFTLGIRNGKLYAWGDNANYRTGLGTNSGDTTTPTQVGSDSGWTDVVAGPAMGAGVRDGKLYTWGNNANYRTAQGTDSGDTTAPTQVGSDTDWLAVGASNSAGFAIKTNGTLYSWGNNSQYSTAQGTDAGTTNSPTQVGSDTDWEFASGMFNTGPTIFQVGLKAGRPVSWGNNSLAATGQNTTSGTTTSPTALVNHTSDTDWTDIQAGAAFGMGVKGGALYGWGNNVGYRNGRGLNTGTTNTATQIGSDTDWTFISLGNIHGVAVKANKLFSWGSNSNGRTGQATTSGTTNNPTQVGTATDWKKVGTRGINAAHSAGIRG